MAKGTAAALIIKKVKKGGHGAHHGGAWKVAYADFVTAMMAFFLLLWLLNVTTDIQKRGIADYFEPTIASKSNSGAGGVLGGLTVGSPGAQQIPLSVPSMALNMPGLRQPNEGEQGNEGGGAGANRDNPDAGGNTDKANEQTAAGRRDADKLGVTRVEVKDNADLDQPGKGATELLADKALSDRQGNKGLTPASANKALTDAELEKQLAEREERQFAQAESQLKQALKDMPELKMLAENLIIDRTPEGLRIQIVDQEKISMFPSGSSEMVDSARKLIALVTQAVQKLPNKISITGHTDATPFARQGNYGNWELSSDRANASRREFLADGLPADRIDRVIGMAERDPLIVDQPTSPRNRRISVVLLREARVPPPQLPEAAPAPTPAAGPAPAPGAPRAPASTEPQLRAPSQTPAQAPASPASQPKPTL